MYSQDRCLVAKSCLALLQPWTVAHQAPLSKGILLAKILEWVAVPFSRASYRPGIDPTFPALAGGF